MGREFVFGKLPKVSVAFRMFNLRVQLSSSLFSQDILITYIPSCHWKMLHELPACLMDFYVPGDAIPGLYSITKHWVLTGFGRQREDTLASTDELYREYKIESYLVNKIDHILKNRSHIGVVKAFILHLHPCPNMEASHIDKWLQFALKPGIEELAFQMSILKKRAEYNFPCSLLSNEAGGSLQSLRLVSCVFHPRTTLGCHKSLTSLHLCYVHITGKELGHFVSNCHALAKLLVSRCNDIICFRVPGMLWHLNHFHVTECQRLRVIEINVPKLSNFVCGENLSQISLGATEVKHITMMSSQPNMICYARTNLPSFMPAVERVTVESLGKVCVMFYVPLPFIL